MEPMSFQKEVKKLDEQKDKVNIVFPKGTR